MSKYSSSLKIDKTAGACQPAVLSKQFAAFDAAPYQFWWPLAEGSHAFQARGVDANGETMLSNVVQITVTK